MGLTALARWCYRRRWMVVGLWVFGFVLINVIGFGAGKSYNDSFSGGTSDSSAAFQLLATKFPSRAGDTADIVFHDPSALRRLNAITHGDIGREIVRELDQAGGDAVFLALPLFRPEHRSIHRCAARDGRVGARP